MKKKKKTQPNCANFDAGSIQYCCNYDGVKFFYDYP